MRFETKHLRVGRFICWVLTGHIWDKTGTRQKMSRTMNRCIYCDKYEAGSD